MDLGLIRGILTAVLLLLFVGIWFWTWSKKRHADFDAMSQLPLDDDDRPPASSADRRQNS